jgi:hypothetical protein
VIVAENNSEARERKILLVLCLLASAHVFIFSAAFPFFNNVDEQIHFDLAVKYSQGRLPRALESVSDETINYLVLCSSSAYVGLATNYPGGQFPPPPWTQPMEKIRPVLLEKMAAWRTVPNYETAQPPLYYSVAGAWWRLGKMLGLDDGHQLYWLRFLNILIIFVLVWLGYFAAQLVFPENLFLRLGVPALIAFIPQTAFYSINNDVLSPVCFGAAFICLMKLLRTGVPDVRLGIFTGLALAATFLTKISNLPLLEVSMLAILFKTAQQASAGKLRVSIPSLLSLVFCAGLPVLFWLAWCKHIFGDFTGTAAKIQFLGWTHKPFAEWWHHPIFKPHGFWIFIHDLLATFWQGEFLWHRQPLAWPVADLIYILASLGLVGIAALNLLPRLKSSTMSQRQALWLSFACLAASVAFLGFLSLAYDFQDCFYPSREHPYFTSGRLMLGALIPFLLLFVYGLDRALNRLGDAVKFSALAGFILFMLATEIAIDWPVFPNPWNWFHM